jgi:nicotinate-nucleotide adenylyltransferase
VRQKRLDKPSPTRLIGIFGGTFDPVHYGHLRPALEVREALGLEQIRLIPLAVAVHRDQPAASSAQRLSMVQAAIAGEPGFAVDAREIHRQGRSYTLDTLSELHAEDPTATLCLLIGGDAFNHFLTWRQPLQILDLAHLVVMTRPGHGASAEPQLQRLRQERLCHSAAALRHSHCGKIFFQPVSQLDISATAIRAMLKHALSPRFLLPDSVLEIIHQQGIYR